MHRLPFLLILALLVGCQSDRSQTKDWTEPERYAELRMSASGKIQVIVGGDTWTGLVTPHGLGGIRRGILCCSTLEGAGPTYLNPTLHLNAPIPRAPHLGSIEVDRVKNTVVISLERVVSASGEPQRTEPSVANGTYPIKRVTRDPFLTPE